MTGITKQIAEAAARLRRSDATNALAQQRMDAAAEALRVKEPKPEPETTEPQMERLDDGVYQDDSGQIFHVRGGEIFPDNISNQNFELEQGPASRVDPPQQLEQQQQETFVGRGGINRTLDNTRFKKMVQDELRFINSDQDPKVAQEIYDETGIIFGQDGQPRLELDDQRAIWDLNALETAYIDAAVKGEDFGEIALDNVFSHEELFEAVPDLANTTVRIQTTMDQNAAAYYDPRADTIHVAYNPNDMGSLKRFILHEAQHAIQDKEGLAFGTNPDSIFQMNFASMVTTGEVGNKVNAMDAMQAISMFKSKDRNSSVPTFPEAITTIAKKLRETDDPAEKARLRQMARSIRELNEYANETYARNLGEVEARDVEGRFDTPISWRDRPALVNPELAEADAKALAEALDRRDSRDVVRAVNEARTPDGVAASKPIDRRNPRKIPWELEDGIHYDLKGGPFKVKNKRIVKMADDEIEDAIEQRPVTQQELDDSVVFQRMRDRAREEAFARARTARDGIDREDPEFKALQEANLQKLKTAAFERKEKQLIAAEQARVKKAAKKRSADSRKQQATKTRPKQKPVREEQEVEDLSVTPEQMQQKAQAFLTETKAPDITKYDSTEAAVALQEWQVEVIENLDMETADIKAIELAMMDLTERYIERFGQASFDRNFGNADQ